jgi:hypothetical protein
MICTTCGGASGSLFARRGFWAFPGLNIQIWETRQLPRRNK